MKRKIFLFAFTRVIPLVYLILTLLTFTFGYLKISAFLFTLTIVFGFSKYIRMSKVQKTYLLNWKVFDKLSDGDDTSGRIIRFIQFAPGDKVQVNITDWYGTDEVKMTYPFKFKNKSLSDRQYYLEKERNRASNKKKIESNSDYHEAFSKLRNKFLDHE